jgi:hypothetical protein
MLRSAHPRIVAIVAAVVSVACAPVIPPPVLQHSSDENVIAHGRDLAVTMGCLNCHSERDTSKLGLPVVAGRAFLGDPTASAVHGFPSSFQFGAPNLTPAHLGSWSDGEIARAIALGQGKHGEGLFPIMPYFEWRDAIAVDDVAAIVSFLRSLPPMDGAAMPERKFPMPGFVVNGFPEARALRETAPRPGDADYGAYVTVRSGCMGCHTEADKRGTFTGEKYAGGRRFTLPAPATGVVYSANLTPDPETGLGTWTQEQFVARFRTLTTEQALQTPIAAGGFQTTMPWTAYAELSDVELEAIFDFLRSLPPTKKQVLPYSKDVPTP